MSTQLTSLLVLTFDGARDILLAVEEILSREVPRQFIVVEEPLTLCGDATCPDGCTVALRRHRADLLMICSQEARDERLAGVLKEVRSRFSSLPVLVAVTGGTVDEVERLLKLGADDFLSVPVRETDLLPRLRRLAPERKAGALTVNLKEKLGLKNFIGESPALLAAIQKIPAVAACDANVLIAGETGTGKELCARAIHYLSSRSAKPFVPVNCGAIPLDLVENELFGHEPGAFTGANGHSAGLLRAAEGGTLLLDEVDALPLSAQVKLLRFLQEGQFQPLGSGKTHSANIRVIAASNTLLDEAVRVGRFRQDLYYRLNVVPIQMPPLRQRKDDIPLLARHFLAKYANEFRRPDTEFSAGAIRKLIAYDWPGNIRELENIVKRALILSASLIIGAEDIQVPESACSTEGCSFRSLKAKVVADFERNYIRQLLAENDGNITRAADAAHKHRRAFWHLMRKHEIKPSSKSFSL